MTAPQPSPRRLLADELSRSDAEMDLARAVLLVAKEEYPQLSVDLYLARLDQVAEEVKDRLANETASLIVLGEVIDTLYTRRKLSGNREAYYDPRNSFLNDVLDRGVGIPLTLGIVILEVSWRLGLPLEGVKFPGHFLVRYTGSEVRLLIDPFDGGMLVRLLTNLKGIYTKIGDDRRSLAVVERLLMIMPTAPLVSRSRGMLLAKLGRHEEAARQLEAYLRVSPAADDTYNVQKLVRELRGGHFEAGGGTA